MLAEFISSYLKIQTGKLLKISLSLSISLSERMIRIYSTTLGSCRSVALRFLSGMGDPSQLFKTGDLYTGFPAYRYLFFRTISFCELTLHWVSSLPELKAHVSFSDHLPSVRHLFFSSSSPEPLGQFKPNLAQSNLGSR